MEGISKKNIPSLKKIIFITGTDTGVGKTLFTALLLNHLRENGCHALAMKPFCSGTRADAELLCALQNGELTIDEINPFFFDEPLAPQVAAQKKGRKNISLKQALEKIYAIKKRCEILLVEGSGGVLVPLGESYTVAKLIANLPCAVIVVARNCLGTINHTLMTDNALQHAGVKKCTFILMNAKKPDISAKSNQMTLQKSLDSAAVFSIPFLGIRASTCAAVKKSSKKIKKTLAHICVPDIFTSVLSNDERKD